ncbi:UDP-glucuronosyl/UDP-glucosyltransferase - like 10 [Theobroma cacao]|nr:UDP-glucuronosyl/UDP-glucosyltransferase - like 10 [Theobroma cacao]
MGNPHILVIPYPAQGHVIPLMELSQNLAKHGFKVSFVNTEFNHKRVMDAFAKKVDADELVQLVSIPDGMEDGESRNQLGKLTESICQVMPKELKQLIEKTNRLEDKITCVVADVNVGWALEVAAELGIHGAAFWPGSALLLSLTFSLQKLMDDGVIDANGTPIDKDKVIQLSPTTPGMYPTNFVWACLGDLFTQKIIFDYMRRNNKAAKEADWLICNSTHDLESGAFNLAPEILPIGPVSASSQLGDLAGSLWPEDETCLQWLDRQQPGSVIYVAFGSLTTFDQIQFQELALGLELSNRPFLWVVRPDITVGKHDVYPEGFRNRVAIRGRMVGWAPQRVVLSHPSVACFLSHCGWNSTIEGASNGVPFLCWPYFADQFLNESYICDFWKVGLRFKRGERGIITREEIKTKVEQLLGDEKTKGRALALKETVKRSVNEGGSSNRIFKNFTEWMKS